MTPKEKAQELVGKCFDTFINDKDEHYVETAWKLSKQFALIAVDEICEILEDNGFTFIEYHDRTTIEYWLQVKQEIEKL
jgi:hypothetical protein